MEREELINIKENNTNARLVEDLWPPERNQQTFPGKRISAPKRLLLELTLMLIYELTLLRIKTKVITNNTVFNFYLLIFSETFLIALGQSVFLRY